MSHDLTSDMHCIEARILPGEFAGQLRLLSCIKLTSIDWELPFVISRVQFPIRLSFAISVNQLYVAMSCVATVTGLSVLLSPAAAEALRTITNIVYPEVLLP